MQRVSTTGGGRGVWATLQNADNLLTLGRFEEALQSLASLGDDGLSARAHCLRARAFLGLKRWKEAESAAAAAMAAAPDDEWGYRLAAITARHRGRTNQAWTLAREAVRLAPHEGNTHQVAALTALDRRDVTTALEHASTLVRLAPHDAMSHRTYARCQISKGQPRLAEAALRRALELDPQDHESMILLAEVVGRKDTRQARELRVTALQTSPQSADYRRHVLRRGGLALGGSSLLAFGKAGLLAKVLGFGAAAHLATNAVTPPSLPPLNGLGEPFQDLADRTPVPFSTPTSPAVPQVGSERSTAHDGGLAAPGPSDTEVLLITLVVLYVLWFLVSRVRRYVHGRKLPPLVWAGTRAERRNADLKWLAWPAGLGVFMCVPGALGQLARGVPPWALAWLLGCSGVLALCWALRRGDARGLTVGDALRMLWQDTTFAFRWSR